MGTTLESIRYLHGSSLLSLAAARRFRVSSIFFLQKATQRLAHVLYPTRLVARHY